MPLPVESKAPTGHCRSVHGRGLRQEERKQTGSNDQCAKGEWTAGGEGRGVAAAAGAHRGHCNRACLQRSTGNRTY